MYGFCLVKLKINYFIFSKGLDDIFINVAKEVECDNEDYESIAKELDCDCELDLS